MGTLVFASKALVTSPSVDDHELDLRILPFLSPPAFSLLARPTYLAGAPSCFLAQIPVWTRLGLVVEFDRDAGGPRVGFEVCWMRFVLVAG